MHISRIRCVKGKTCKRDICRISMNICIRWKEHISFGYNPRKTHRTVMTTKTIEETIVAKEMKGDIYSIYMHTIFCFCMNRLSGINIVLFYARKFTSGGRKGILKTLRSKLMQTSTIRFNIKVRDISKPLLW